MLHYSYGVNHLHIHNAVHISVHYKFMCPVLWMAATGSNKESVPTCGMIQALSCAVFAISHPTNRHFSGDPPRLLVSGDPPMLLEKVYSVILYNK